MPVPGRARTTSSGLGSAGSVVLFVEVTGAAGCWDGFALHQGAGAIIRVLRRPLCKQPIILQSERSVTFAHGQKKAPAPHQAVTAQEKHGSPAAEIGRASCREGEWHHVIDGH